MRATIRTSLTAAAALAALLACTGAAQAASSTSLALSESLATSVGSVSDSFRGSSRSSTGEPRRLAAGEYRIVEVAAADRAGRVQLKLQPIDAHSAEGAARSAEGAARITQGAARNAEGFTLELPERALARTPLTVGDTITATPRPFGVEFALAATREAFFLVLDDDWYRELAAKPLV